MGEWARGMAEVGGFSNGTFQSNKGALLPGGLAPKKKKKQKKIKAPGSSGKTTGASAMRMRRLGSRGPRRVTLAFDSIELGGASLHGKH